ncbi:MAG TPA: NAD(P)/FAD-dependent oxidoreductase [Thermoanaerobaculia bacterium]|nr:NAD(P)/FAD-dependent oxidoreductase [Thermoanaerobaculia bacterium]
MKKPHIVILGGGFGGLYAARSLADAPVDITLIDRRNFHLFQPLLYQVATAALNPADIAEPIRSILRKQENVRVVLAEATAVHPARNVVETSEGEIAYDQLIVATGATHSYFGNEEWAKRAPGLKTLEDAVEIRRRVLLAFEEAEHENDPGKRAAWLTFVVAGAGPTGVEIAGALSEVARHTMVRDFRRIDPSTARVILVEAREHVLPSYPNKLSEKARTQLEELGVEVITGKRVTDIRDDAVELDGVPIPARTVLWAAGIQGSPIARTLGAPLDNAGLVLVDNTLTIPGHHNVHVVGDLAHVEKEDGVLVPAVAPAAIQEGLHAAKNIRRAIEGKPLLPFRYWDKGSLATIGRAAAVADFGPFQFGGFLAWMAWLVIHIFFLIGFRNRFLVISQWAWAYLTYERGARLITTAEGACSTCTET